MVTFQYYYINIQDKSLTVTISEISTTETFIAENL
jgi:hypothetical protein